MRLSDLGQPLDEDAVYLIKDNWLELGDYPTEPRPQNVNARL